MKVDVNYVNNFYNNDTVIYDFDNMLLGKWHSSFDSSVKGAIEFDNMISEYLNLHKGKDKTIMDFGCGIGTSLFEYAQKYPQHNFIGLNVSPKQINIAKKTLLKKNLKNVKFVLYNGTKLPFSNEIFDVIYSFEAFCHVEDKNNMFSQFYKKLNKGGILLLTDWNLSPKAHNLYYNLQIPKVISCINGVNKNLAIPSMYSIDKYENMLTKIGFFISHKGYLDEIAKGHLDDNFSGEKGLYDYDEKIDFGSLFNVCNQLFQDGIYRLKLYFNYKNKVDPIVKKQLDNGYKSLNNATDNGFFKIGIIRCFKLELPVPNE
jgi:ubiquinone/menaquinone biosynthesis C-methylase UbiE